MTSLKTFCLGVFAASVVGGLWWLVLLSGILTLIIQRSYIVLSAAVILDILFATGVSAPLYGGFYTLLFILVTGIAEFVRSRLLWTA